MNKLPLIIFILCVLPMPLQAAEVFEITRKVAEEKIAAAITAQQGSGKYKAVITGINQDKLFLSGEPVEVAIDNLKYDPRTNAFTVALQYMNSDKLAGSRVFKGRAESYARVPVLKARMSGGSTVKPGDITWLEIPARSISADTVVKDGDMFGKTLKYSVAAMRPIKLSALQNPGVFKKGDVVQMLYRKGAIEIKTSGIAQVEGRVGSIAKVLNSKSGVEIIGKVGADGVVQIGQGG